MRKQLLSHRKWRFPLLRWHRRIGMTVSLLVLWLSVTGILLNHSEQLELDDKPVSQSLLMALYDIKPPVLTSYPVGDRWISHAGANHVYLDEMEVAYCAMPFNGAVWHNNQYVVSCGGGLLLLTQSGEVLERLGASYGFPQPVLALAVVEQQLLLKTSQGIIKADPQSLQWWPYRETSEIPWATAGVAPPLLQAQLSEQEGAQSLTWERVVLDLHNGRLVGRLGVWLLDAAAVLLIVLALSGIWIQATSPRR